MNVEGSGRKSAPEQTKETSSPSFLQKEHESFSKGFQGIFGILKNPNQEVENTKDVKKICYCIEITATVAAVICATAAIFSGPVGTFFYVLAAILASDARKVAGKLISRLDSRFPDFSLSTLTKNTILAKPLTKILKPYFKKNQKIEENEESEEILDRKTENKKCLNEYFDDDDSF